MSSSASHRRHSRKNTKKVDAVAQVDAILAEVDEGAAKSGKEAAAKEQNGRKETKKAPADEKPTPELVAKLRAKISSLETELDAARSAAAARDKAGSKGSTGAALSELAQAAAVTHSHVDAVRGVASLVDALRELHASEQAAAGRAAARRHAASLDDLESRYTAALGDPSALGELAHDAGLVVGEYATVDRLRGEDGSTFSARLNVIEGTLKSVAPKAAEGVSLDDVSGTTGELGTLVREFSEWRSQFHAEVDGPLARVDEVIAAALAEAQAAAHISSFSSAVPARLADFAAAAAAQAKSRRVAVPDPEHVVRRRAAAAAARVAADALAGTSSLVDALDAKAATNARLVGARKAHRQASRALEDAIEDGEADGQSGDALRHTVAETKAELASAARADEEAAQAVAAAARAAGVPCPPEGESSGAGLSNRRLDDYAYETVADGVLRATLKGAETDGEVVLKVVQKPDGAELSKLVARTQTIVHPALAPVQALFTVGPHLYVEVPAYTVGDASAWLASASPSSEEKRRVLRDVATALAALHAAGVSHGNIRPSKVFVTADGRGVLSDHWGCSSPAPDSAFVAPEALADPAAAATEAADIFSFGLVAYEFFHGPPPRRDAAKTPVAIPKSDNKLVYSLLKALCALDARKRPTAAAALANAFFAPDFVMTTKGTLVKSNMTLDDVLSTVCEGAAGADGSAALAKTQALVDELFEERAGGWLWLRASPDAAACRQLGASLAAAVAAPGGLARRLPPAFFRRVGAEPTDSDGVRDLLADLELLSPPLAASLRSRRLALTLAEDEDAEAAQLVVSEASHAVYGEGRGAGLDAVREGLLSVLPKGAATLRPSEVAILLAGRGYLDGAAVVDQLHVAPRADKESVSSLLAVLRTMPSIDLRRLLYTVTGSASLPPASQVAARVRTVAALDTPLAAHRPTAELLLSPSQAVDDLRRELEAIVDAVDVPLGE
jgi:hypothetical protein